MFYKNMYNKYSNKDPLPKIYTMNYLKINLFILDSRLKETLQNIFLRIYQDMCNLKFFINIIFSELFSRIRSIEPHHCVVWTEISPHLNFWKLIHIYAVLKNFSSRTLYFLNFYNHFSQNNVANITCVPFLKSLGHIFLFGPALQ